MEPELDKYLDMTDDQIDNLLFGMDLNKNIEQNKKVVENQKKNIYKFDKKKYSSSKELTDNLFKNLNIDKSGEEILSSEEFNKKITI